VLAPLLALAVPVVRRIEAIPLLPQTKGVGSPGAVHREHPIEVVDLMLEQLSQPALAFELVRFSFEVLVSDPDVAR
jgi:hypothetical protein